MEIADLVKNIRDMTSYQVEQKLDFLVRTNPAFSNLNADNRELILNLIKGYRDHLRKGIPVTEYKIRRDHYRLYRNRLKLKLTEKDLRDIKELLEAFKS